jgi:exodeoxyribonuclease V alpha subunit
VPFLLCAPTGIAAKNLSARTGAPASTIHRAFGAKGIREDSSRVAGYVGVQKTGGQTDPSEDGGVTWEYHPGSPHPAQVVIVDESSMVDQNLLFRLLSCTSPTCRLVFVGDYAQLPSVGPGNVLRDLITSGRFPTVKLTQIFRQENTSGIVYAAHAIHKGDVPETDPDFRLVPLASEDDVLEAVLRISEKFYKARVNFQVLSPRHAGTVGVTNLNLRLRDLLNPQVPGAHEVRIGDAVIREGDRIMVVKNDYRLDVFNGDVGKVAKIDLERQEIEIKIFGEPPLQIMMKFKEAVNLIRLAYACTVHKSQGLEYGRVVMPLVTGFRHQLQRNLLYTAITRAKRQVILIGHHEALGMAVANAKEDERMTLFLDRLAPLIPVSRG